MRGVFIDITRHGSILPCIRPHQTYSMYSGLASSALVGAAKTIPSLSRLYHCVAHSHNKRSTQTPVGANHLENTFPTSWVIAQLEHHLVEILSNFHLNNCVVANHSITSVDRSAAVHFNNFISLVPPRQNLYKPFNERPYPQAISCPVWFYR